MKAVVLWMVAMNPWFFAPAYSDTWSETIERLMSSGDILVCAGDARVPSRDGGSAIVSWVAWAESTQTDDLSYQLRFVIGVPDRSPVCLPPVSSGPTPWTQGLRLGWGPPITIIDCGKSKADLRSSFSTAESVLRRRCGWKIKQVRWMTKTGTWSDSKPSSEEVGYTVPDRWKTP